MSHTSHVLNRAEGYKIFVGPNGLRAGWRLLIFLALFLPLGYGTLWVSDLWLNRLHLEVDTALGMDIGIGLPAIALFLVSGVMARIEGRSLAAYGLPWRRAFCRQFWQGAAISFLSLTVLLLVFRWLGVFSFGSLALHGADIWKQAAAWIIPMFLGALTEDFLYRGYFLFTLTTGIGFWPAAIVSSLIMGGTHYFAPGGHGLGPIATTEYCLLTCLILRRTGDLWMPLGLHAGWNYSAIFIFSIGSGGRTVLGHLMDPSLHGPTWLTGGQYGPEGSWSNVILLTVWAIGFSLWLRGVRYPDPAAVRARR